MLRGRFQLLTRLALVATITGLSLGLTACNNATGARLTTVESEDGPVNLSALSQLDPSDHLAPTARIAAPAGRQGEWITFSNHCHSTYWDGKKPLTTMIKEAKGAGIQAMDLTDHNTMRGIESPEFQGEKDLVMVKGMEWGAWREKGETVLGHAGLLGLDGTESIPTNASIDQMLAEATARKATIIINHPFANNNSWQQAKPDERAHAIEVWNHWWALANPIIHNDKALAWWNQALCDGRRITAMGGTDSHGHWYDSLEKPTNYVFVKERTPQAILEAIREGHVSVLQDASSARLVLEADDDGDGVYEAINGDVLTAQTLHHVKIRAHVLGGKGKYVVFYAKRGRLSVAKVEADEAFLPIEVVSMPGQTDFVRAELKSDVTKSWSMTAIANPIYLR